VHVRVVTFARLRELLGGERTVELSSGADISQLWASLAREAPIADLAASTRAARNGRICAFSTALEDGDEVALMPPVGGG
jgi:molybdopterin converting factor small subunit